LFYFHLAAFGGFACLFPLAFYCLILTNLNNRRRPTLVSGPADFAGVLLATAGFLIVGGPVVLAGLYEGWRRSVMRGDFVTIRAALAGSSWQWLAVWAAYFAVVVGGAGWLLWRRRSVSVVYNIDPAGGQKLIGELLDGLRLPWVRRGASYAIGLTGSPDSVRKSAERAVLEVTQAPALRHLTLHWTGEYRPVRPRFEAALQEALEGMEAPESPVAGWFLTAATGLFALLLILLGLFILFLYHLRS
jgi:hypothetical protein